MRTPLSSLLIATGICALGFVAFARIDSAIGEQRARAELAADAAAEAPPPDTSEWSEGRRKAWERSQTQPAGAPVGILSIASIGLRVALLKGTDEVTLNRGVGTVDGTRLESNLGIAGHRDGFFSGLGSVASGDRIRLETRSAAYEYRVVELAVVRPEDVHVLDPTEEPKLTLVTCYPFFWLGPAPERFIVHAVRVASSASGGPGAAARSRLRASQRRSRR